MKLMVQGNVHLTRANPRVSPISSLEHHPAMSFRTFRASPWFLSQQSSIPSCLPSVCHLCHLIAWLTSRSSTMFPCAFSTPGFEAMDSTHLRKCGWPYCQAYTYYPIHISRVIQDQCRTVSMLGICVSLLKEIGPYRRVDDDPCYLSRTQVWKDLVGPHNENAGLVNYMAGLDKGKMLSGIPTFYCP